MQTQRRQRFLNQDLKQFGIVARNLADLSLVHPGIETAKQR
jgi:hypothetical protein